MKLFSHPSVLQQIGSARLAKFLSEFNADLTAANISPPTPEAKNGSYFDSVAAILDGSVSLSQGLRDAIAKLEAAASPENQNRLDAAITRLLPCVAVSHSCVLDRALELWFHLPEELSQFQAAAAEPTPSPLARERLGRHKRVRPWPLQRICRS